MRAVLQIVNFISLNFILILVKSFNTSVAIFVVLSFAYISRYHNIVF